MPWVGLRRIPILFLQRKWKLSFVAERRIVVRAQASKTSRTAHSLLKRPEVDREYHQRGSLGSRGLSCTSITLGRA